MPLAWKSPQPGSARGVPLAWKSTQRRTQALAWLARWKSHAGMTWRSGLNHPLIARLLPASDRRSARQTFQMGAITAVQLLGGLAQLTLSARILGPEGFGILAIIVAVAALVHGLLAAPGGEAVTTFVTRAVAEKRPCETSCILRFTIAMSLGLSLVAYALIAVLVVTASSLLGIEYAYRDVALMYGVVGVFLATRTECLAVLRLSDRLSLGLAIVLAGVAIRTALLGTAWLQGGGLFEVVLAHIAGVAVSGAGMLVAAAVSAPRAGITGFLSSPSLDVPADVVRFQTGVFGRSSVSALAYNVDTLLVAQLTGVAEVGLYRAARQIIETGHHPFQPLKDGVQLQYSRQWYSGQGAALRRTSLLFGLASLISAVALFGLLAIFHQPIAWFFLGDEFSGGAPLLLIMIFGAFAVNSISALTVLPAAVGRAWPMLAAEIGGFATFVAGIVWLVPLYGAEGAAWANTTYYSAIALILVPFIVATLRRSRRLRQKP